MFFFCFLRCLRDFEKWSWLGKIGKNEEKMRKKAAPESPYIHYCHWINKNLLAQNLSLACNG